MHCSGALVRWLIDNDLVESRATPSGVTIQATSVMSAGTKTIAVCEV